MIALLRSPAAGVLSALVMLTMAIAPVLAQFDTEYDPGTPEFERTWERTDKPVADGIVERTWMWGPGRTEVMTEPYEDSPGGERQVQYFDKSRMEINDPAAVDDGLWYVTNGLLVIEMVEGWYQTGDEAFDRSPDPANIQIAGDPGQEFGPTYRDIHDLDLRDIPADNEGDRIIRTLTADDQIVDDERFARYDVTAAERVTVPTIDQTVAEPFWAFMTSTGTVYEDGEFVTDDLFLDPFYATGYPITPAFWSRVPVAGQTQDVLWQCFERRCLTYTPSNNEGFQVEAGNVGQHYWLWRYGEQPEPETFEVEVTIENLSFGQPLSPAVAATHDPSVMMFGVGELSSSQLASIAQDGDQAPMVNMLSGLDEVTDVVDVGEPLVPLGSDAGGFTDTVTFTIEVAPGDVLSVATMLICSNDGFTGVSNVIVPDDGSEVVYEVGAYDAGVEENTQASEDLVDPCSVLGPVELAGDPNGNSNLHATDPADPIAMHPGILAATGDLTPAAHGWTDPIARITINKEAEAPSYDGTYYVDFGELNDSGVDGVAELTLAGNQLTVDIEATGMTPDEMHPQHIHGPEGDVATCPDASFDEDGDGLVELDEGEDAYGPVIIPLFENELAETYPEADVDGVLDYSHTFTLSDDELTALADPLDRVFVLHGLLVDDSYRPTVPVACGEITEDEPQIDFDGEYYAELDPLNDSGVVGAALLTLDGDELTVVLQASGMVPGEQHPQHIHGFTNDGNGETSSLSIVENAICPDNTFDENDDGIVSVDEGTPAYGPVLIPLEPFPTANAAGAISYNQTLDVDPDDVDDPAKRVVVLHGMVDPDTDDYDPSTPVACGEITVAPDDTEAVDYHAVLDALNESGVTGTVEMTLAGPWLTVSLETTGNEPGVVHPQHIHGFADSGAICPDETYDDDGDDIVGIGEGEPAYGPVVLPLTPYPTATFAGDVSYDRTFLVNLSAIGDLTDRVIVTHGMVDPDTTTYDPSIPVSCGPVAAGELPPPPPEPDEYLLSFGELNDSGVSATGTLTLQGDQLTVEISASGLEPSAAHPQHLHGDDGELAFCPGPDFDLSGDGLVNLEEGLEAYGGVRLALYVGDETGDPPVADADGDLVFSETYTVDPSTTAADLEDRVVVLHGLTLDGEYVQNLPVACSLVIPADASTYMADDLSTENVLPDEPVSDGSGSALFWYDDAGAVMYYMLLVQDVDDLTAAHIHQGDDTDESGQVVVPLFGLAVDADPVAAFGILSSGRITDADLTGPLDGMTLDDLEALFLGGEDLSSDAYVNVHSEAYPAGVLRDQVTAAGTVAE